MPLGSRQQSWAGDPGRAKARLALRIADLNFGAIAPGAAGACADDPPVPPIDARVDARVDARAQPRRA